jgi:hypothetical protein
MKGSGRKARRKDTSKESKRRREDNIKMDLRWLGWDDIGWVDMVQGRDHRSLL